ncbi:hypothetical protein KC219_22360, partial [Mycobacterium tuberculosis]|nr:hypothetical protein [Mycobacterium tuberculosis]
DIRLLANIVPSIGTASDIADQMQEQAAVAGLDGFVALPAIAPEGVASFVDEVVPELRQRGVFRHAYDATTLRGHLGLAHPARLERAS